MPNPKIAAYTVITNNYDKLWSWTKQSIPVDFYCFTDDPDSLINHMPGRVKVVKMGNTLRPTDNDILVPFSYRLFPFEIPELKEYDLLIYLDGNSEILQENAIERLLASYPIMEHGVSMLRHGARNCLFKEIFACRGLPKYRDALNFDQQIETYRQQDVPEQFGFWSNNRIFWNRRVHQDEVKKLQELWFEETGKYGRPGIKNHTAQGQVTLAYALWALNTPILSIPSHEYTNGFRFRQHYRPQVLNINSKEHSIGKS